MNGLKGHLACRVVTAGWHATQDKGWQADSPTVNDDQVTRQLSWVLKTWVYQADDKARLR